MPHLWRSRVAPRHARRTRPSRKFPGIDWSKESIYFGDERAVPPTHPDSNFAMAKAALFDRVPLPAANIHRIHAEDPDQDAAARAYEALLPARIFSDGPRHR